MFALAAFMALSLPAAANSEKELLKQYVDENTQRLVQKLNAERGLYEQDPKPSMPAWKKADQLRGFSPLPPA